MANGDDRIERAEAEQEHLDGERRSLAAINAAFGCICADAETIRGTAVGGARVPLMLAFSQRLSAMRLLLAAFEPLAKTLSEKHGRRVLRERIDTLNAETSWASTNAVIAVDVDRIFAEFTDGKHTSAPALRELERRLTLLDGFAVAVARGRDGSARDLLTEVLRDVRAKIQALEQPSTGWQKFLDVVTPGPEQPATDAEQAEVRRIQREMDADNRATTMKIFEIQRQAQQDAHESVLRIHDSTDKMKL